MIQVKKQLQNGEYIFRHVNVNKETVKTLLDNFVKGSTFSSGEVRGIMEDFGQAIAHALASNGKVVIEGLGTFSLTVSGAGRHADPADLRKDNIKPSVRFVPSADFLAPILKAEIVVKADGVDDAESNDESEEKPGDTQQPEQGGERD